jgi:hypothetical protein
MKVDVPGLMAAAQKLLGLATSAQGLLAETAPLAADPTSGGAALRLDTASMALWGAACAQALSLHTAATHLMMVAAKFATQEEINTYGLTMLEGVSKATDDVALATLPPVPALPPDVRMPISPGTPLTGEGFAHLVHKGSAANGVGFSNTSTNNGITIDTAAMTVREVAAAVPELWESPTGTAALTGRLNEYVTNLNAIADRWFALGDQSRRHADDFSQTVSATPKPEEFQQAHTEFNQATNPIAKSQAALALGRLESLATAEASRYAGVTDATTGVGTPQAPAPGVPAGAGVPAAAGTGAGAGASAQGAAGQGQQLAPSAAAEAGQAGEAGDPAGQLAQMLPQALGAIGGMAGGLAGMAGQIPQQLMQAGQGLAQTAQQGLGGLMSKNATDAELTKKAGDFKAGDLSKEGLGAGGAGGGGGGGVGDTHPAGGLGPAVIPSTSHTSPTMPAGAAPPPTTPAPSGGTAMGAMPMGMPMSGMMGHGQGAGDGADKVPADKKVVTPSQPHTEAVTGRVPDRTAAAAEAARTRADSESDSDDDPPPRGPVMRRITLAPLDSERT